MGKIGRNDRCPCQSGKKYKHCCASKDEAARQQQAAAYQSNRITLMSAVAAMQAAAEQKQATVRELGVFILFATVTGDAWLLEMTDSDCIQIAAAGQAIDAQITETPETIEVNWSHKFVVKDKSLELTAYADKQTLRLLDAPSREIHAAIRRIHKKFTAQQLRQVHVDNQENAS